MLKCKMKKVVAAIGIIALLITGIQVTTIESKAAGYASFNTGYTYVIKNIKSGKYLNIPGNSSKRVNPITIYQKDNSKGQNFKLTKVSSWYTLTPGCASTLRVNVEGSTSKSNLDVGTYKNTNHSTQGWYFEPVKGGYVIRSANNKNCVLDIRGLSNGSKVKIKTYEKGNTGQIWTVTACKTPSTLTVSPALQKSKITCGSTNGVSGTVKSNYKITSVSGQIIGQKDNYCYFTKRDTPNKTSYSLTEKIDNAMLFNKLKAGPYIFKVTAEDASGKTVSKSVNCTVEAKPVNLTSKTLGVPYYSQDDKAWNKVKIGNSSQYIGMVNGKSGSGCLLTDVAMIERYVRKNSSITPRTIAQTKNQFSGANFRWDTGYGKNYASTSTSLTNMYNQITAGHPVVASVYKAGEGQHWVVIYGYKDVKLDKYKKPTLAKSNFLIRDPGWKSRTKLSIYSSVKIARVRK